MFKKFKDELKEKRKRHVDEVQRFILKSKERTDVRQLLTAADLSADIFYGNLEGLAKKWLGADAPIGDCDGRRLVNEVLLREINNPIFHAIIFDKLDCFISSFKDASHPPIFWLELACICGSQKVAIYLLGNISKDIWVRSNIIPYALSSGNNDFALEIARIMKSCSVTDAGLVTLYRFGNFSTAEQISQLLTGSDLTTQPTK